MVPLPAVATIREYPEVLEVVYVDKERALEKAREDLGEFADLFEPGVLPASLDISLNPGFRTPSHVEEVVDRLQSFTFLEDIRYGQEWIQKLYRLRVIATIVGAGYTRHRSIAMLQVYYNKLEQQKTLPVYYSVFDNIGM